MEALGIVLSGIWEGFLACMVFVGTITTILFVCSAMTGKHNG